jgi:hypothetical protein
MNGKTPILVHIKSKYVNASKFCINRNTQINRWNRLKYIDTNVKKYAKDNNINTDDVVKKGLEYDSGDVWIPCEMLPCLAQWCGCEFNLPKFLEALSIDMKDISSYCKVDFKTGEIEDTKKGYVYCVSNPLYGNVYKVGCTKRTPDSRVQELNSTNTFIDFKLEFAKKVDDCYAMEKELHLLLAECRVRPDREFFKCPLEEIKDMFEKVDG